MDNIILGYALRIIKHYNELHMHLRISSNRCIN